ncbi:PREDICTED: LOW QUALITY PROTEIN: T-cell surface glycoprotein CD8 alpha chain [Chaetura pelagica]|uniref:LOW QUALITY PROTEIN: T-cell surface glycoprotein CD8 alpha chain n=1 Tax=Chaetura pelagica TaxID=8897 RepID=UPI00052348D3|nr:PREDICTED: LOW QUALITY PROTEIN: T-cell surface glycoprotein CD8 alpha chain [Chaetura pelagica]
MARAPALLLLLALELCCPGIRGQRYQLTARFRDRNINHPREGEQLELECLTNRDDTGMFWIHQDMGGTLHFIVFISSLSRTTFENDKKTATRFQAEATHFQAWKEGTIYRLVVKSFTPQDEGTYFCLMNNNQMLYFSSGQPAFFPVTTTAAPTTAVPTTAPTNQTDITQDPCLKSPAPDTSKEKELNYFCDILIWVPLSGACFLLVLALAITIMLCQQTRRRRCRCKRPAYGKPNVKPIPPSQYT